MDGFQAGSTKSPACSPCFDSTARPATGCSCLTLHLSHRPGQEEAIMTRIPAVGELLRSSSSGTLRQEARGARAPVCPTASSSRFYGTMSVAATLPRPTPTTRWQASLHHATIPRSLHSSANIRAPAPPTPASSTETPDIVPLSQQEYSQLTDRVFDSLVGQLETLLDEMDDQSWEVEYSVSELV